MSRLSRPAWLTTGLLIGAIAVPAVAFAAGAQLVSIRGNDHTASVTPAGQLRIAEMDPVFNFHDSGDFATPADSTECFSLGVPSSSRAAILKNVAFNPRVVPDNRAVDAYLQTGSDCSGPVIAQMHSDQQTVQSVDLGNGVAVPANTNLSVYVAGGGESLGLDLYGYTVQASDVPNTAGTFRRAGPRATKSVKR